jgi:hypothetical protein
VICWIENTYSWLLVFIPPRFWYGHIILLYLMYLIFLFFTILSLQWEVANTAEISSFQLSRPHFCWFQQDTNSNFQVRNIELLVPYFFHNIYNQVFQMYISKKQISKCRPCNVQIMILLFQKFLECGEPAFDMNIVLKFISPCRTRLLLSASTI